MEKRKVKIEMEIDERVRFNQFTLAVKHYSDEMLTCFLAQTIRMMAEKGLVEGVRILEK